MSRRQPPKHPTGNAEPLSLDEEGVYAQLCLIANDRAPEPDRKRLEDAAKHSPELIYNKPKADEVMAAKDAKTPPALPQHRACARDKAIRYLITRFEGTTVRVALAAAQASWGDVQAYRWLDPQFRVAQDFVERERKALILAKANDAAIQLLDGSAPEGTNAQLAFRILERLQREDYSDPNRHGADQGGGARGGGITYNITFAGNAPANLCGVCAATPAPQPIIEVKGE